MNRAILMGRLTRDPEVRYSSGEKSMAIARYTLAVDRGFKRGGDSNEQTADFIPCIAFDKAGDFAEKVYTTEIIIDTQEFADSKGESTGERKKKQETNVDADGFMNIPDGADDEGLPFN